MLFTYSFYPQDYYPDLIPHLVFLPRLARLSGVAQFKMLNLKNKETVSDFSEISSLSYMGRTDLDSLDRQWYCIERNDKGLYNGHSAIGNETHEMTFFQLLEGASKTLSLYPCPANTRYSCSENSCRSSAFGT